MEFQSTHSVRSAINILMHRAEQIAVSIHALREECDSSGNERASILVRFQSTHSVRSAIRYDVGKDRIEDVSIHALREECDPNSCAAW